MPSVKRSGIKSQEVKTGFEAYEGPEPTRRGFYRGRITRFNYKEYSSGATGIDVTIVFEADPKNDPNGKAQYNGFPLSGRIIFGDKEAMITRENNLYAALGVKDEPSIVFEEGEPTAGLKITKIGGKNPIGLFVNADLRMGQYLGEARPELDGIYKVKPGTGVAAKVADDEDEDDESDLVDEDAEGEETEDEEDEVEAEIAARTLELGKLTLVKLKAEAKELELDVAGLKKPELIEAILDAEYGEDEEAEEEEDDVEAEEEEEEEDEDDGAERRAELEALDRNGLKSVLKEADPEARILKKHTDSNLVDMIIAAENGEEAPF